MKLKYFLGLIFSAILFVGCSDDNDLVGPLENISLDKTYVSIDPNGGSVNLTVTSSTDWKFDEVFSTITKNDDGSRDTTWYAIPDWLTVTPTSGVAGTTTEVTISAAKCDYGRETELQITSGGKTQFLMVRQGSMEASDATCAEIIAGADGKTYRVKGVVTSIANTTYGNWYLQDETGQVYIYGTLDADGATKNFTSLGIEIGDYVKVEGPKTTYNGTVELVDVTVLEIIKSLIKVTSEDATLSKEGGEFQVKVAYKGNGCMVTIPEEYQSWIAYSNMEYIKGVPTKLETNPADTALVTFKCAANEGEARNATIEFRSANGDGESSATYKIAQETGLEVFSLPFEETFMTNGIGAFIMSEITPREDGTPIWYNDPKYGMVAKAGSSVETKAMLISPKINLQNCTSPVITFEHTGKYVGDMYHELTFWVSIDGGETWTQLLIPNYPTFNDWNYVSSGDISLKAFAGQIVNIAFQYVSTTSAYATWEIKNVKIEDRTPELNCIAQINNATATEEAGWTATLTDALVTYVNGNSAFIQDATGGIQLYQTGHELQAGQLINGKVKGTSKLYNMYAEATSLDLSEATVAETNVEPIEIGLDVLLNDYLRYQNCMIQMEDVTFETELTTSNRNGVISQNGYSIAAYAQVKGTIEMSGSGTLICFPTRYKTNLQLGVWANEHFKED